MRYLVLTDLHGQADPFLSLLKDRGWYIETIGGYEVLRHTEETLLYLGDANDRGPDSVYLTALLLASAMLPDLNGEDSNVVYLRGNHEQRLLRFLQEGKSNDQYGFDVTRKQLEEPKNLNRLKLLERFLDHLPYWYVEKSFVAAHAYLDPTRPNKNLALYGPTHPDRKDANGLPERIPWWLNYNSTKWMLFGHYHADGTLYDLEKRYICLDNHDSGMFSYVVIDSIEGLVEFVPDR